MILKNICFLFLTPIMSTFAFSFLIANMSNKAVKQLFMLLMLVSLYMKILWAHWHSFILFYKNTETPNSTPPRGRSFNLGSMGRGVNVKMGEILTELFFMGTVSWQQRNKT